jgi:hypothetical protein
MPISPGGTKYEDEELDSLFKAVGFVVVQWGQAEQSLDMLVAMIYQQLGGKQFAKRLPKMLSTKLKFLTECLSKISVLAPFRADGDALVADFQRLSDRRNDLIHGAIASLSPHNGAFVFAKLDIEDDLHRVREFRFESSEFPVLTKDLIDLGAHATSLARLIWELVQK